MKACVTFGKVCLVLAWVAWISNGCVFRREDDDSPTPLDTLVLPKAFLDSIFTKQGLNGGELLDRVLKNGMRIYEGTNPPEMYNFGVTGIEGVKFMVEHDCIYDEKAPGNKDSTYGKYRETIRIQKNGSNNALASVSYYSVRDAKYPQYPDSLDRGTGTGYASGDRNNFTIFYKVTGAVYDNIRYDALWIISGTVVTPPNAPHVQRVTDVTKCLIMLDKRGTDAGDKKVANKGTVRIFRDNVLDWVQPALSLSGLSPGEGQGGTTVTINGFGFSTTPGENIVRFGATQVAVLTATTTRLTVAVPAGPPGGTVVPVTVRVKDQTSNSLLFTYGVTLSGLSPAEGPDSTIVTITGVGFSPKPNEKENIVRFGTTPTAVRSATPTQLTVAVPPGPPGGTIVPVTVQVKDRVSNPLSFTYGVRITALSPGGTYIPATKVTITGSGFSQTKNENTVLFGSTPALVEVATPTQLTVVVPPGPPGGGTVQVTVQVKTKISNQLPFAYQVLE